MGRTGKLLVLFLLTTSPSLTVGNPVIKYEESFTEGRDVIKKRFLPI